MSDVFSYLPGEKCFAKVKGFPFWPARINYLPPDVKVPKGKYPIFFYGTHEVCFLPKGAICSYEQSKDKFGGSSRYHNFNKGIEELEKNGTIFELGSDPKALRFLSQFYSFSDKKAKGFVRTLKSNKKKSKETNNSKNNKAQLTIALTKKSVVANSEGFSEQETESKSSLETSNLSNPSLSINTMDNDLPLNLMVQDRGPIMMIKHEFSTVKLENSFKPLVPVEPDCSMENVDNKSGILTQESVDTHEDIPDNESVTKADSVLNETLSTICMADLSSDDQMEAETDSNTENKTVGSTSTHYLQDFGYLMVQIKKFAWSPERQIEFQRKLKNQKYDSRLRVFFPWYQLPKQ